MMAATNPGNGVSAIAEEAPIPPSEVDPACDLPRIEWLDAAGIFAPLPPQPWTIEGLQLAPGRPGLLGGFNGSGKTMAAQGAALAYAIGDRVWGQFSTNRGGKVAHFNYDQGGFGTRARYHALARGMGIDPRDLDGRLRLANSPAVHLTHERALDVFMRECEGVDLAIVDAFRGAARGAEENDSAVREYLDILKDVSEQTQTAFILVHHTRKRNADKSDDPREMFRGSGAIVDGSGAAFLFEGMGANPRKVTHVRNHEAALCAPIEGFYLDLVRESFEGDPAGIVRVEYRTREQVEGGPRSASRDWEDAVKRVLDAIRSNPGIKGKEKLAALAKMKQQTCRSIVDDLIEDGSVRNGGSKDRPVLYVIAKDGPHE